MHANHKSSSIEPQLGIIGKGLPSTLFSTSQTTLAHGKRNLLLLGETSILQMLDEPAQSVSVVRPIGNSLYHQPCITYSRLQTDTHGPIISIE